MKEICVQINQFSEDEREKAYSIFIKSIVNIIMDDFVNGEGQDCNANFWKNSKKKEKISLSSLYHRIFGSICMNYVLLGGPYLTWFIVCAKKTTFFA